MKKKVWTVSVLGNKSVQPREDVNFYTSDTDAHIIVELRDERFNPTSANIVLHNKDDGSTIEKDVTVTSRKIDYTLGEEILHAGYWLFQIVYINDGKQYTTAPIGFSVGGNLLDLNKPSMAVIRSWEAIQSQVNSMLEEEKERDLVESLRISNENKRKAAERDRLALYSNMLSDYESGAFKGEPFTYDDFTADQLEDLRSGVGNNLEGILIEFNKEWIIND